VETSSRQRFRFTSWFWRMPCANLWIELPHWSNVSTSWRPGSIAIPATTFSLPRKIHLTLFIHEGTERPFCQAFFRRRRQRGRLREGGKSLEGSFSNTNAARGSFRADFRRTSPAIQCRYPGSSGARLCGAGPKVLHQPGQEVPVRVT
jgi:hypothetical protein